MMDFPDQQARPAMRAIRRWFMYLAAIATAGAGLGVMGLLLRHPAYEYRSIAMMVLLLYWSVVMPLGLLAWTRWRRAMRRVDRIRFGILEDYGARLCAAALGLLSALVVVPELAGQVLGVPVTSLTGRLVLLALALGAIAFMLRSLWTLAHDEAGRAASRE